MKATTILAIALCLIFAGRLVADGPTADQIKIAQQWAFALAVSAQTQIKAGATDAKAIRKKATEDTQPQEKQLRAAMKEMGFTPKDIDQGIKDDRSLYLEDVESDIKAFQKRKP